jgi:hypothetical protein
MANVTSRPIRSLTRFLTVLGAAVDASAAVRNHRRPADGALKTLGIDPDQFPKTN